MNVKQELNYCVLSNSNILSKFDEYTIIEDNISFEELISKIETYMQKTICFNDVLRKYNKSKVNKILNLLKKRSINYINITSDIEDALLCDYIFVFNKDELIMEGSKEDVLKEEKILKRIGYGLPFVVDLSMQLVYYNVIDKIYYDLDSLVNDLWN